ncbi:MAG: hypothetical protein QOJ21_2998 [Solirubrobacteraceae bacterium]|jgi:hypothetical protein|nr:hypothetical protein [Solirubrobacteraceae bacterium]
MPDATIPESILDATVRIPQHVVFRSFVQETVILNLETGQYHGLNKTAGRMLEAVEKAGTIREALPALREEFPEAEDLQVDLIEFCSQLSSRGLIELTPVS